MIKTFQVTQADITAARKEAGDTNKSRSEICPVARCLRRSGYPHAKVGVCDVIFDESDGGDGAWCPMPSYVRDAVARFDLQNRLEPFTFMLDVPE